jgi:streptomycin 6-kinase
VLTEGIRRSILASGDAAAIEWMRRLPVTVDELCARWGLTAGATLDGGKGALVLRVTRADGSEAILKVAQPGPFTSGELTTLEAADGRGYVQIYAADHARGAALLEPLGGMLGVSGRPIDEQLGVLARTLTAAWQVPIPTAAAADYAAGWRKAAELAEAIPADFERTGRPCSPRLIDAALESAAARLASTAPTVLCHGDPHPANALERAGDYVFVDPDGFVCEPAYDLGVTVRSYCEEVLAAADPVALHRGWCAQLSAATGVDAQSIWEWAFTERVSSGLFLLVCGYESEGDDHLRSAERLLSR